MTIRHLFPIVLFGQYADFNSAFYFTVVWLIYVCLSGATEIARTDIARPSTLWGLTSRDHIARVDIARPDNAAPDQTEMYNNSCMEY